MKLVAGVALLIVTGQAVGFFLAYRSSSEQVLQAARDSAAQETWLIRQSLEYRMLEKDDRLLRAMIDGFVADRTFQRVIILDRQGVVRISSDPEIRERHFQANSPTCQVCHRHVGSERELSTTLEVAGGTVLRCVQPIPNREACHACHNPEHRINGLIIVDVPLQRTLANLESSARMLAFGTGGITLVLLGCIGLVFRRLVLRRLFRFEAVARAIAQGELEHRVPVDGRDALNRVEEQFNNMADSVTGLLTQLKQQRANLERVMNSVDDGLVVLDRNRTIVAANEAFLRRFQGGPGVIGRSCCENDGQGTLGCRHDGECPTLECFRTGNVPTIIKVRDLPDGASRREEVHASPVYDHQGAITHVVEMWRDITDRLSAEARLAESQRMISVGMLASGFSHEVNTPLASIAACLDGIKRLCVGGRLPETRDQDIVGEYLRTAAEQVRRCGSITEQFLQLARGRSLVRDIVDLPACAEMTARLCKQIAREANVSIVVAPAEGTPAVMANPAAVQQVLLNLTLNAVEASAPGSQVRISFDMGEQARVRVEDSGRGIAPEDIGRVFEPFFTRREKGTGLGLFVSMNLARGWGGDILVESRVGAGSTFTMVFPRTSADEANDGKVQNPGG